VPFEPSHHAPSVHRLLEAGYADGGGSVADFDSWWSGLVNDAEYDPGLIFLVGRQSAAPVAAAICWSSAFVKDIVVAAGLRRRGLASNLLRHIFSVFRARSADAVDLKVHSNNCDAISLYRSVGMTCVETLHVPS
jgi:ribosomal protein S18 acetylase RimI-like enzyme